MPLLARLVIALAMLTSGWMNCFGQVQIRTEIVEGLQELEIEVHEPVQSDSTAVDEGEEGLESTEPTMSKATTRGVNRIVWLIHAKWPELGGWGTFLAWSAAVAQLVTGVLLFVGLFTRLAAFVVCVATGMAIYIVSAHVHGMFTMNPFDWPHDSHRFIQLFAGLGVFTLALGLLFGGGGKFSIDSRHASSAVSPKKIPTKKSTD
ncbi:DoxX family protein [bacterium]|nr:DoxX family protein [bacterium]